MSESTTAQIIMFPTRALASETMVAVARPQPEPTEAEARLSRALIGLNEAVTAQRAAIAAWKTSLGDLSTATGRLGSSLRSYNDSLGQLDARVKTLRTEAVKLEAWADDVIASEV
jgi:small-conductance mechanosensitive channel